MIDVNNLCPLQEFCIDQQNIVAFGRRLDVCIIIRWNIVQKDLYKHDDISHMKEEQAADLQMPLQVASCLTQRITERTIFDVN